MTSDKTGDLMFFSLIGLSLAAGIIIGISLGAWST
jgi:hypothetical protein